MGNDIGRPKKDQRYFPCAPPTGLRAASPQDVVGAGGTYSRQWPNYPTPIAVEPPEQRGSDHRGGAHAAALGVGHRTLRTSVMGSSQPSVVPRGIMETPRPNEDAGSRCGGSSAGSVS